MKETDEIDPRHHWPEIDTQRTKLEANARRFQFDPHLDPIADAMDRGDTEAWSRLHPTVQDRASIYRDFRESYRRAVNAGAIPDDRNATTYEESR